MMRHDMTGQDRHNTDMTYHNLTWYDTVFKDWLSLRKQPHLVKCKFTLEMDEEPSVAEEVVKAGLGLHEGMHGWVQQLHQLPQCQQLTMHGPAPK